MPKYNVGVGDAFPADEIPPRSAEDDDRIDRPNGRSCSGRYGYHRNWPFRVGIILVGIWAVLSLFAHGHAPNGLLIGAGILFVIGLANRLFGDGDRWRDRRRAWREERRRRREDR